MLSSSSGLMSNLSSEKVINDGSSFPSALNSKVNFESYSSSYTFGIMTVISSATIRI